MSKAKAVSAGVTTSPASGASAAAKAATRRKAHPKFELPEVHAHTATDWAFRNEAPRTPVMPTAADIAAVEYRPQPVKQPHRQTAAPWEAPLFLSSAVIGGTALGLGIVFLTGFAAVQMMTAPARIARSLF